MATVEDRVVGVVCSKLSVTREQVNLNSSFITDLGADSLDAVELVMALEEEFDIEITDEEAETITTVSSAIEAVKERL